MHNRTSSTRRIVPINHGVRRMICSQLRSFDISSLSLVGPVMPNLYQSAIWKRRARICRRAFYRARWSTIPLINPVRTRATDCHAPYDVRTRILLCTLKCSRKSGKSTRKTYFKIKTKRKFVFIHFHTYSSLFPQTYRDVEYRYCIMLFYFLTVLCRVPYIFDRFIPKKSMFRVRKYFSHPFTGDAVKYSIKDNQNYQIL